MRHDARQRANRFQAAFAAAGVMSLLAHRPTIGGACIIQMSEPTRQACRVRGSTARRARTVVRGLFTLRLRLSLPLLFVLLPVFLIEALFMPDHPEANGSKVLDCVVVGGGPAGLTAALYLRRFHRQVRVIDAGAGRARKISTSHNVVGFPDGVAGAQLLDLMQQHLRHVGDDVIRDTVDRIERTADGLFAIELANVQTSGPSGGLANAGLRARNVLLCTGVQDRLPALPGAAAVEAADLLRYCPVCDGYEHTGQRIGVIANSGHGAREAAFLLKTFSSDVWFIEVEGRSDDLDHALRVAGVPRLAGLARHLGVAPDRQALVATDDGAVHRFDVLYAGLGVDARTQLAVSLGAALDDAGSIVIDAKGRTNIDKLYAAGDVANALDQIGVAVGHAAIAATAIHNSL